MYNTIQDNTCHRKHQACTERGQLDEVFWFVSTPREHPLSFSRSRDSQRRKEYRAGGGHWGLGQRYEKRRVLHCSRSRREQHAHLPEPAELQNTMHCIVCTIQLNTIPVTKHTDVGNWNWSLWFRLFAPTDLRAERLTTYSPPFSDSSLRMPSAREGIEPGAGIPRHKAPRLFSRP